MSEPTTEQLQRAALIFLDCEWHDDDGFFVRGRTQDLLRDALTALLVRAESAEAERDRYKAALAKIAGYEPDCDICEDLIAVASAALAAAEVQP